MILYFSGTGNSAYAAERIGENTGDDVLNLCGRIKNHDFSKIHSDRPWVIAAPAYAWRIPHILHEWLEKAELSGNREIYFVITCAGKIGNAGQYLKKLCESKNLLYMGSIPVIMPNNYVVLSPVTGKKEAVEIVQRAEEKLDKAAYFIENHRKFPQLSATVGDKVNSSFVNGMFYKMFVQGKKFYAADTCVSCGKCADMCPLNNIRIENGKPVWGKDCTHCMACICRCPSEAIEYGKQTRGKLRYTCPK